MTRQRIEEILEWAKANDRMPGVTDAVILSTELRELCRLALRAFPKVEWEEKTGFFPSWITEVFGYLLETYEIDDMWPWAIDSAMEQSAVTGRAYTLEAAKAAAEAALGKLMGGGE